MSNNLMIKRNLTPIAAMLLSLPLAAMAAPPPVVVPGAGSILQQVQPVVPSTPSTDATGLKLAPQGASNLPQSAPFTVSAITISGNTIFDVNTLHSLVMNAEGQQLTLEDIGKLATRISDYYHSHGYPLSRAIVPAQTIHAGIVQIEVIEARYGKIALDNRSRVNDSLLQATTARLQSGQPVEQTQLNRSLLLLSDIPGVGISATMQAGQEVGSSDLEIQTAETTFVNGNVTADNDGNRYTGRERIGGNVSLVDPLHHGDVLNVSVLSTGSDMNYGSVSYDFLLDGSGTRLGGNYSALHYILGDNLSALDGHGTADVGSVWAKHPFIRSQDVNVYAQVQYDNKQLKDQLDSSSIFTDRTISDWSVSASGDWRDTFLSGGVNSWNLGVTSGRVGFDNAAAQTSDAATAKTQGNFVKWNANLVRLQNLSPTNWLYVSLTSQYANSNLDSAEKMVAGGAYTVRAYDMGVLSGDTGYLGTAEVRHNLGALWAGQWQAIAFVDSEHITVNRNTWTTGENAATLSGAGAGLKWVGADQWSANLYVAAPLGTTPALLTGDRSVRAWAQISKGF